MGGIVGRLFREFAVTLSVAIVVSMVISLTTTPMMCALLLKPHRRGEARPALPCERAGASTRSWRSTTDARDWVLRHQPLTLAVTLGTMAATVFLYVEDPEGLLPAAGHGPPDGPDPRRPGHVVPGDEPAPRSSSSAIVVQDPAVDNVNALRGRRQRHEHRPHVRRPEGRRTSASCRADAGHRAAAAEARRSPRGDPLPPVGPGPAHRRPPERGAVPVHAAGRRRATSSTSGRRRCSQRMRKIPGARRRQQRPADQGPRGLADDRPRDGLAARRHAAGDRRHALRRLRPAAGLDDVHARSTSTTSSWRSTRSSGRDPDGLDVVCVRSSDGSLVPLSAFARYEPSTAPLAVNHQGQFPSVTISFNLPPGVSLGDAVDGSSRARREIGLPATIRGSFQGTAQAFQDSLANEPILILAALLTVYIVLGILYESLIHPITILSTLPSAGVGALLALLLSARRSCPSSR